MCLLIKKDMLHTHVRTESYRQCLLFLGRLWRRYDGVCQTLWYISVEYEWRRLNIHSGTCILIITIRTLITDFCSRFWQGLSETKTAISKGASLRRRWLTSPTDVGERPQQRSRDPQRGILFLPGVILRASTNIYYAGHVKDRAAAECENNGGFSLNWLATHE